MCVCVYTAGVQLYFLWLSYFYLALALRENVLLVNGSAIKAWWIEHHYWSAGGCLLLLGLPVYSPGKPLRTQCNAFCAHVLLCQIKQHFLCILIQWQNSRICVCVCACVCVYLCVCVALFMFCQYFLMWSSLQGIVMMFQNRYQRRRM